MKISGWFIGSAILPVVLMGHASSAAGYGPGSGGGGKGVVCRNADQSIKSAELLDLWEARELYGATILPNHDSLLETVKRVVQALGTALPSDDAERKAVDNDGHVVQDVKGPEANSADILGMAGIFFRRDLPDVRRLHGVHLALSNDSLEPISPTGCAIEQIVRYDDLSYGQGSVLLDEDIFEQMDVTNQAALIVHEALYKLLRDRNNEANSLRVRRTVGLAFSGYVFTSTDKAHFPAEYYVCEDQKPDLAHRSTVYAFPVAPITTPAGKKMNVLVFQAGTLRGMDMLGNTVLTQLPDYGGGSYFDSMRDLTSLRGLNDILNTSGRVQPELRASLKVLSARPRALTIAISSAPSPFFPAGIEGTKLDCKYHKHL